MLSRAQRDQAAHPQCEIISEKVHISLLTTQCQPANVSPLGSGRLALGNPEPHSERITAVGCPRKGEEEVCSGSKQ